MSSFEFVSRLAIACHWPLWVIEIRLAYLAGIVVAILNILEGEGARRYRVMYRSSASVHSRDGLRLDVRRGGAGRNHGYDQRSATS